MMTSLRASAIAAGQSASCHPDSRFCGTASVVWCSHCGATFHVDSAEALVIQAEEDLVARRAAARAHELELERASHTSQEHPYRAVSEREAAAHRRTLAEVSRR